MGYNSNIQRDDWECDEMFTNENLKRLILPLVVEQILAVTIGMSDTIMVSSVGEAAVSGLSLVDTINILLINIFAALATGGAVVCSQYLGGRDRDRACVSAKQLIVSTGIFAVIIMGICSWSLRMWSRQSCGMQRSILKYPHGPTRLSRCIIPELHCFAPWGIPKFQ